MQGTIDLLQEDRLAMENLLADARSALREPLRVDPKKIDLLRWQFDKVLSRHLHTLQTEVVAWGYTAGFESLVVVERLTSLTRDLQAAFETHRERYKPGAASATQPEYMVSAAAIIRLTEDLFDEERLLVTSLAR